MFQRYESDTLNRVHKVLTQINIKYQHLIKDIEGVSAMKITERMAQGEISPEALLAGVKTEQLKASEEDLIKSLTGIFRPHYVTVLQNHLKAYDFYKEQMKVYE